MIYYICKKNCFCPFFRDMKERFEELMELLGMSPTQFAQTTGIQRSTLQHILNGRNEPSLNVVRSIHDALPDVDLEWLLTGNGKPIKDGAAAMSDDDYPLFRNVENGVFRPDAGNNPEFLNHEKVEKPSRIRKKTENKSVNSDNTASVQEQPMRVKEIVVFYEDGTYQKFSSTILKK